MSECLPWTNEYQLSCCSIIHSIPSEIDTARCFAVSDACLLLINHGNDQLYLYDLSLSSLKFNEISWSSETYGLIRDISWSTRTKSFLILGEDALCSYCPQSNHIQIHLNLQTINDRFWSLAVLGCDLFVLYRNDQLDRYCLPSWTLTHQWSRDQLISNYSIDNYIEQIRTHSTMGFIALLIRLKHQRRWRIDIFDRKMQKLYTGESIRMTLAYPLVMLQPFGQHGRWILMNEDHVWTVNYNGHFLERYSRRKQKENSSFSPCKNLQ